MNQIIMILLISLLVLVHEIGHFVAARMCGVRVTRFGIGMPIGPSWKMFKWKNTTFYIHAFLFGGYVSFADDEKNFDDSSIQVGEDKKNEADKEEYLPSTSPELYENKTIAQKFFIVSAGVLMNVVFAIFLVMFSAAAFHKLPASEQNITIDGFAKEKTSNIYEKGARSGDKFESINSKKIKTYYQLIFYVKNSKLFDDYAQEDLVNENLKELKTLNPNIADENLLLEKTQIKLPKPKAEKPLEVNDNVLSGLEKYKKQGIELNKNQIDLRNNIYSKDSFEANNVSLKDIALALSDTYKPLDITFIRDGKEVLINEVVVDKSGLMGTSLKIDDIYIETKTIKDITVKSIDYLYTTTSMMLFSLWQLFTGKVSASDMHGVIAIVKVGGDIIASKGILNGLLLTAMISINLAIMNFLPIPALDGGHVMFLIVEKLTGKKPSLETSEKINNFFFILLIILMIAICYNDIAALVTKKF